MRTRTLLAAVVGVNLASLFVQWANADEHASFTPAELQKRQVHRRAVEAAIWGMPAVNFQLMQQEMVDKLHGDYNQILYWPKLLDWKNQTLTPNPDVIYLMPFFNTEKVGPIVLEVPPADDGVLNGSLMDYWQAAIEDIGPGGVDKGKGGKYLFLPPRYKEKIPKGYIPMRSTTYRGYALIRSVLKSGSDADLATAVKYSKRLKLYPLSQAADPPETKYLDASDVVIDSTIRYDASFYETLNAIVQAEPFLERDKAMIDPLKAIGIERGKPFKPDAGTQAIFKEAVREARAVLEVVGAKLPPYYEGEHWFFPTTEEFHQNIIRDYRVPDSYPIDVRGFMYTVAFFSAKHLGQSQYYLLTNSDKEGQPLDGSANYRLHVPANAPVTQYWSMTVYDRETHAFIRNVSRAGRSSQSPGLKKNEDGSVDIEFGPTAPVSGDSN